VDEVKAEPAEPEASTLPSAPRAGILTGPERSGPVPDGCKATSATVFVRRRGRGARQLAQAVRRHLERGCLKFAPEELQVYSVTFTCRSGSKADICSALEKFVPLFERRVRVGGILLALDRQPKSGRWHVHSLAVLPARMDPRKLRVWWARLWPRPSRPVRAAQYPRRLATPEIDRALTHHLCRVRNGIPIPELPPLAERVLVAGEMCAVWTAVCQSRGIPVKVRNAPTRHLGRRLKKPLPRQPRRSRGVRLCRWCEEPLSMAARPSQRTCSSSCRSSTSRALLMLGQTLGLEARRRAQQLAQRGWSLRAAIRSVAAKFTFAEENSAPLRLSRLGPVKCRCRRRLAPRRNAKTCGRSACRTRRWRQRERRRSIRVIDGWQLSETWFDTFGPDPFSGGHAAAIAGRYRFPKSRTRRILARLVRAGVLEESPSSGRFRFLRDPSRESHACEKRDPASAPRLSANGAGSLRIAPTCPASESRIRRPVAPSPSYAADSSHATSARKRASFREDAVLVLPRAGP
jgi:hypothetical protein